MIKQANRFLLLSILILSGCGGSEPENLATKYSLVATATPYINAMPSVLISGQTASCISLIIPFEVTSKTLPLPNGFTLKTVSILKSGSAVWNQGVATAETNLVGKQTIQGIARGCSPDIISAGETLELRILVAAENSETEITTSAKLSVAY
jgi:hypothetical protein